MELQSQKWQSSPRGGHRSILIEFNPRCTLNVSLGSAIADGGTEQQRSNISNSCTVYTATALQGGRGTLKKASSFCACEDVVVLYL